MKKQQGLSLIQLIIIITIAAILASIAIPTYNDYIIRAKLSSKIAGIGSLKADIAERLREKQIVNSKDVLVIDANEVVVGSKVFLTPVIADDIVYWSCGAIGLTNSQFPAGCNSAVVVNDTPIATANECDLLEGISIDGDVFNVTTIDNGAVITERFTSIHAAIVKFKKELMMK